MSRLDATQERLRKAGAALTVWRRGKTPPWTLNDLAAHLTGQVAGGLRPTPSLLSKWEKGTAAPGDGYYAALSTLGAPVEGWHPGPQGGVRSVVARQPAIDASMERVQRELEQGVPLGEVYVTASKALASTLAGGLSPDRQRAWNTLLRTLNDGARERGRMPPLEEHPDWDRVVELLLDAVAEVPGGTQRLLEAVHRVAPASSKRVRKAAA